MTTNYSLTALFYKEVRIQKVLFRKLASRILKPITALCQSVWHCQHKLAAWCPQSIRLVGGICGGSVGWAGAQSHWQRSHQGS